MRSVMQIGLHARAEWIYLTRKNWVEQAETWHISMQPSASLCRNPEPFRYIGVDCAPESVAHCAKKYENNKLATWICAGVGSTISVSHLPNLKAWYKFDVGLNVHHLFVPFHELIKALHMESLDVLAIDIDGSEYTLFDTMDEWTVFPEYIAIETHGAVVEGHRKIETNDRNVLVNQLKDKVERHGYSTAYDGENRNFKGRDVHFRRTK